MKKIIIKDQTFVALPGIMTTQSWGLPHDISYEEWRSAGLRLGQIKDWTNFAIGDWINFGEAKWGETYVQAVSELKINEERLRQMKWVSSRLPVYCRNNKLTWSHHYAVASLETEKERVDWLAKAEKENLGVRELRDQLVAVGLSEKRVKSVEQPAIKIPIEVHHHCMACGKTVTKEGERCDCRPINGELKSTAICPVCDEEPATILVCPRCVNSIHLAIAQIQNKNIHKRKGRKYGTREDGNLTGSE
jgi:hypothetical protein